MPISPIKGQMLALRPPDESESTVPSSLLRRVLFGESCYIIPRRDGRIIVGATVEPEAGFSTRSTAGGVQQLLGAACSTIPSLSDYTLDDTWAGLRPSTVPTPARLESSNLADGCAHSSGLGRRLLCSLVLVVCSCGQPDLLPLLGTTPWSNTHLASGYHRNGILLSPLYAHRHATSNLMPCTRCSQGLIPHALHPHVCLPHPTIATMPPTHEHHSPIACQQLRASDCRFHRRSSEPLRRCPHLTVRVGSLPSRHRRRRRRQVGADRIRAAARRARCYAYNADADATTADGDPHRCTSRRACSFEGAVTIL